MTITIYEDKDLRGKKRILINNDDDYRAMLEKIRDIHGGRHYFNQSSFAI